MTTALALALQEASTYSEARLVGEFKKLPTQILQNSNMQLLADHPDPTVGMGCRAVARVRDHLASMYGGEVVSGNSALRVFRAPRGTTVHVSGCC